MEHAENARSCPRCGRALAVGATSCLSCAEADPIEIETAARADLPPRPRRRRRFDDDEDELLLRRRRRDADQSVDQPGLDWIVPMRESMTAIAAGYLGLFSCLPLVGFLAAVPAVFLGIRALRSLRMSPGCPGALRAWTGIVLGSSMGLLWLVSIVAFIVLSLIQRH